MASVRVGSYWHRRNSVVHNVSLFSPSWTTSGSVHGDYMAWWHTQWEVSACMFFKRGWQSDLRFITRLVLINFWSLHIQKPLNWRQFFHYSHMYFNKLWSWFYKDSSFLKYSAGKVCGSQSVQFGAGLPCWRKHYRNLNHDLMRNFSFGLHVVV